jgi:hypothetical protein
MKVYGGVDAQIHIFLTSALVGGEWSAPGTHLIGGWVGPRAGLDEVEKRKFLTLPGLELRPLGLPGRSQFLCRLSYFCSRNLPRTLTNINGSCYSDVQGLW